jgi:hypothetical protein
MRTWLPLGNLLLAILAYPPSFFICLYAEMIVDFSCFKSFNLMMGIAWSILTKETLST